MEITKRFTKLAQPALRSSIASPRTRLSRALPRRAFSAYSPARHTRKSVSYGSRFIQRQTAPQGLPFQSIRENSTASDATRPLTDRPDQPQTEPTQREVPSYELTFTCKPCLTRSKHRVSKQGYHSGTVLISCPNCKSRHVISDHLKIFSDTSMTVEQLLAGKGETVKKGVLGEDGDMEFWDDGSSTPREVSPDQAVEPTLPVGDRQS